MYNATFGHNSTFLVMESGDICLEATNTTLLGGIISVSPYLTYFKCYISSELSVSNFIVDDLQVSSCHQCLGYGDQSDAMMLTVYLHIIATLSMSDHEPKTRGDTDMMGRNVVEVISQKSLSI